jgi:stage IV sporulation protein B
MAGIGTMTYYDPATGVFGALGHGITDVDTAQLMPFANGSILPSTVKAVKKGEVGSAGELRGNFDLTVDLGGLYANTTSGIFGTMAVSDALELGEAVPIGQAVAGPAVIWSNVEGDTVEEYDIEILKVVSNAADSRDMVISVTDPDLVAVTGGIVQGMSGSPVLQDGKLVGAVTHVLLNDPTKGYGIFIQNMLDAAGNGAA